jgi:alpha-tubulin suppressor-like RCC1 family protein
MIAGGVKCWGDNESGQLGDGTTMTRTVPVDVLTPSGPLTGVRTIAAGYQHTCAIMMTGGLRCWGRNVEGQLGDGTTNARYSPSNSDAVPGVQAIAMGIYHTCAITAAGTQCWGYNMSGQVGDGTMTNRTAPTTVMTASVALGAAQAVGAGGYHSCAIMPTTRGVRCWGLNGLGQLGDGTTVDHEVAPDIDGLGGVSALAAGGYHTCALTTAGGVRCWGLNADGELGDGTTSNRSTAPNTDTLSGVLAITAGNSHGCALTATGVRCWGLNAHGQIGDGTTTNRLTPGPEVAICP